MIKKKLFIVKNGEYVILEPLERFEIYRWVVLK